MEMDYQFCNATNRSFVIGHALVTWQVKEALKLDYRPAISVPGAWNPVISQILIGCHFHCHRPDHVLNLLCVTLTIGLQDKIG